MPLTCVCVCVYAGMGNRSTVEVSKWKKLQFEWKQCSRMNSRRKTKKKQIGTRKQIINSFAFHNPAGGRCRRWRLCVLPFSTVVPLDCSRRDERFWVVPHTHTPRHTPATYCSTSFDRKYPLANVIHPLFATVYLSRGYTTHLSPLRVQPLRTPQARFFFSRLLNTNNIYHIRCI